jgi:TIR domain
MITFPEPEGRYDVFLSHSHLDAEWVEELAKRLQDERQIRAWLDRWVLIPGKPWQRDMARGLQQAASCAVCIGQQTPQGWFEMEITKALNRQAADKEFRVIPVLLPDADTSLAESLGDTFLELNTWVDFRQSADPHRAFHLLACGIKGIAPGRWRPQLPGETPSSKVAQEPNQLRPLRQVGGLLMSSGHRRGSLSGESLEHLQRRARDQNQALVVLC